MYSLATISKYAILIPHAIPPTLLLLVCVLSRTSNDPAFLWLVAAFSWRYFRFFVHSYSYLFLRPTRNDPPAHQQRACLKQEDVTIIIPTISVFHKNPDFAECLSTCLGNRPFMIIIVTSTPEQASEAKKRVESIRDALQAQGIDVSGVKLRVENTRNKTNKRIQMIYTVEDVETDYIMYVDDHVFLQPDFLRRVLPEFQDSRVGLVGTTKEVRRSSPHVPPGAGWYWPLLWYWTLLWNVMGAIYLERHNFQIQAANAMDGGVFVVSARAMLIRTKIVRDPGFAKSFLTEQAAFGLIGPIVAGDDNFITRWVLSRGYDIKITDAASIETTLGKFPQFLGQIVRWRRTTFQNMGILLEPALWRRWPWTTWTDHIAHLSNFALFWDGGMMCLLSRTEFYSTSSNPKVLLVLFGSFTCLTKLQKSWRYFRKHPVDFFLFFPMCILFAYFHTLVSVYAYLTVWDLRWTGRKFTDV